MATTLARKESDQALTTYSLRQLLVNAGFKRVSVHTHRFPVTVSKEQMFEGFRQRDTSWLGPLTDREIEAGIREVDARFPGDTLAFESVRDFLVAEV